MVTEAYYPLLGEAVSRPGSIAEAVEHQSDPAIRKAAGKVTHHFDHFTIGAVSMLTRAIPGHPQPTVLAALPVNNELDKRFTLVDRSNDFFHEETYQPLFVR